jgi:hypothetical protein
VAHEASRSLSSVDSRIRGIGVRRYDRQLKSKSQDLRLYDCVLFRLRLQGQNVDEGVMGTLPYRSSSSLPMTW